MAGENAQSLNLHEPVSGKKLRVFYMEGITGSPIIQPLEDEMRYALKKVTGKFCKKKLNSEILEFIFFAFFFLENLKSFHSVMSMFFIQKIPKTLQFQIIPILARFATDIGEKM